MTAVLTPSPDDDDKSIAGAKAIQQFTFDQKINIRTIEIDGKRWAVSADICAALEIKNPSDVLGRLDSADKLLLRRSDTLDSNEGIWDAFAPQVQSIGLVSEDGATDLILESRKPQARRFRRFLTHTVWPSIRDTGSYSTTPAIMPTHAEALRGWAAEVDRADLAEARAVELEPSAVAWDRLYELGTDFEVGDAAKILSRDPNIEVGQNRLFEFMNDQDWIFRGRHNCWKAYQEQVDCGRLSHRPGGEYFHEASGRYRRGDPKILVTAKGLAELRKLLGGGTQLTLVSS